ncbi:MAG: potassium channel family protein [Anaerolineae bacterium]
MSSGPIRRALNWLAARPRRSTVGLILSILVVGTIFYHLVEGWNILDSVYFCVITLTTIGYGD